MQRLRIFYLRKTECRTNKSEKTISAPLKVRASRAPPLCSKFSVSKMTDRCIAALNVWLTSRPLALRIVKSLEVSSVNRSSSGTSAATIAHKSKHKAEENNSLPKMDRVVGI